MTRHVHDFSDWPRTLTDAECEAFTAQRGQVLLTDASDSRQSH